MNDRRIVLLASLLASLAIAACSDAKPKPPAPAGPRPPAAQSSAPAGTSSASAPGAAAKDVDGAAPTWPLSSATSDSTVIEVGGLSFPKPTTWQWQLPTMQFRTLQYAVAGEGDSTKAAELIVSVFMAGDGGPLDANITRWKGQFRQGDAAPEPKVTDKEVGPLKVKFVELEGDYMAMGAAGAKKDFSQIGAIVQASGRNVFFRLIGPKVTVAANRTDFMKMIDGLMPAD